MDNAPPPNHSRIVLKMQTTVNLIECNRNDLFLNVFTCEEDNETIHPHFTAVQTQMLTRTFYTHTHTNTCAHTES